MEHSLGLLFISVFILGISGISLPDDDIFVCTKNTFKFGEPSGAMIRNSSFVLEPHETLSKIKIVWPLVKMYMQVRGATFTICDSSTPTVDIVDYDSKEHGHFMVTREGGSQAFGSVTVSFIPKASASSNQKKERQTTFYANYDDK